MRGGVTTGVIAAAVVIGGSDGFQGEECSGDALRVEGEVDVNHGGTVVMRFHGD